MGSALIYNLMQYFSTCHAGIFGKFMISDGERRLQRQGRCAFREVVDYHLSRGWDAVLNCLGLVRWFSG